MFAATALTFLCLLCTEPEWYKIQHIRPLLNEVLPSECFADSMRSMAVPDKWIKLLATAQNQIPVKFYRENSNVVGYMNPGEDTIHLNRKFHDGFGFCKTGSNIAHEILHVQGFRHFIDPAYATNRAFEQCCFEENYH